MLSLIPRVTVPGRGYEPFSDLRKNVYKGVKVIGG